MLQFAILMHLDLIWRICQVVCFKRFSRKLSKRDFEILNIFLNNAAFRFLAVFLFFDFKADLGFFKILAKLNFGPIFNKLFMAFSILAIFYDFPLIGFLPFPEKVSNFSIFSTEKGLKPTKMWDIMRWVPSGSGMFQELSCVSEDLSHDFKFCHMVGSLSHNCLSREKNQMWHLNLICKMIYILCNMNFSNIET